MIFGFVAGALRYIGAFLGAAGLATWAYLDLSRSTPTVALWMAAAMVLFGAQVGDVLGNWLGSRLLRHLLARAAARACRELRRKEPGFRRSQSWWP